jgi:hypothetical protein
VDTISPLPEEDRDIATADFPPTLRLPGKPHARAKHCPPANRNQELPLELAGILEKGWYCLPAKGKLSASATQRPPGEMTGRAPHGHGWAQLGVPIDYT